MKLLLNNLLNLTKTFKQFNNPATFCLLHQRNYCVAVNKNDENQQANIARQKIKEQQSAQQKTLTIAVIGVPNAGKSTFINNLINHRVSTKIIDTNYKFSNYCIFMFVGMSNIQQGTHY